MGRWRTSTCHLKDNALAAVKGRVRTMTAPNERHHPDRVGANHRTQRGEYLPRDYYRMTRIAPHSAGAVIGTVTTWHELGAPSRTLISDVAESRGSVQIPCEGLSIVEMNLQTGASVVNVTGPTNRIDQSYLHRRIDTQVVAQDRS